MSKPEAIPPEVRNTVLAILRDDNKGSLGVAIASAILAERDACAVAAADAMKGYRPAGIDPDLWPDPAAAIRARQ